MWSDYFVGSLAIGIAFMSVASAVGLTALPYQLQSIQTVHRRFGDGAARLLFLLVAVLMLTTGAAIIGGVRPPFSGAAPKYPARMP